MFTWLTGSDTKPPLFLAFRSSKTFIITTVATAIFTDIFVYGIIVPVLPFALTSRADIQPDSIQQWISIFLAVYGAALLAAAPVCGWLADRTSSRYWPLLLGILALAGSTAILCTGKSIAALAAGRVLQGISAAVVWVVGLALIVDTVGPEEVGQAMGYMGLSMSLAMLVAPLLGGVVFASSGYYAVFAMAFGLMALDVFLRIIMVEKKIAVRWTRPETAESQKKIRPETADAQSPSSMEMEAATTARDSPQETQTRTAEKPSDHPDVERMQSAGSTVPANAPEPIKRWFEKLPPVITLLASRRLLSALFGCIVQATVLTAFDTILPLFVRDTFRWNSKGAGLIFLPIVIVSFLGPVVGWLTDKHGPRFYAIAGYTLACPCLILLRLVHKNNIEHKVLLCALLALVGLSLTLSITPMMAEITYAVEAKARRRPAGFFGKNGAYAQAYSLFNVAWAAGCMVGPLLAGLVNQSLGWNVATLILGCISLFTAVPASIWTGGSIFKKLRARKEERRRQDANPS